MRPGITKVGLRPRATQAKPKDGVSVAERQGAATQEAAAAGGGRRDFG